MSNTTDQAGTLEAVGKSGNRVRYESVIGKGDLLFTPQYTP